MKEEVKREDKRGVKIASVSYLNSIAFTYGVEQSGLIDAELTLAPPAKCTSLLASGEVDIALIPVAAIPTLGEDFEVITTHCIGASAAVRTVVLLSDEPLDQITDVWLDADSQSSVRLLAHLAEHHFKIAPRWHILSDMSRLEHPKDGDAFLLIGDKVFAQEGSFEYSFDLAEEWIKHTGLPFVFAAWCCRKGTDESYIADLEDALTWGVERTYEALCELRSDVEMEDGYRYLTENIDPLLDAPKREAMARFWASTSRIELAKE